MKTLFTSTDDIYICIILISLLRTRRSFNKYVIWVNECLQWWVVFNTISCHLHCRFLLCIDDISWRGRRLRVWGHDGNSDHPRHIPLPGLSWQLVPRYTGVKCTSEDCEQERGAALNCSVCGQSRVWAKLQAPVYDILPSTTAVFSYAIGSRKLSTNEFFVGAQTVVSLLQTTQIKQGVSFIAANKVYTSTNKTAIVWIETELFFFFYPGWLRLMFTCVLWR